MILMSVLMPLSSLFWVGFTHEMRCERVSQFNVNSLGTGELHLNIFAVMYTGWEFAITVHLHEVCFRHKVTMTFVMVQPLSGTLCTVAIMSNKKRGTDHFLYQPWLGWEELEKLKPNCKSTLIINVLLLSTCMSRVILTAEMFVCWENVCFNFAIWNETVKLKIGSIHN